MGRAMSCLQYRTPEGTFPYSTRFRKRADCGKLDCCLVRYLDLVILRRCSWQLRQQLEVPHQLLGLSHVVLTLLLLRLLINQGTIME
jgi:hypothetical protein